MTVKESGYKLVQQNNG